MAAMATSTTAMAARLMSTPTTLSLKSTSRLSFKTHSFSTSSLRFNHQSKPLRFTTRSSSSSSSSSSTSTISATISIGDKLPDSTFSYIDSSDELQTTTVSDLTKGKKTIFFAVPGAFTPTCSQKHVPGFVEKSSDLKAKGIDTIACISVNDAFVMKAWKEDLKIGDEVLLLSDGNGDFTRAIGAELDLSDKPVGLGVRSRRYALLAEDGVVKVLNMEEGGAFTFSGAEDMLKSL